MRVVAVVVAYNRRTLLLECLSALYAQDRELDAVVVVDNGSSDSSGEAVAAQYPNVDLVSLLVNTGGAGGFAIGMARAISTHAADLVWVMDDDTVPTITALSAMLAVHRASASPIAITASRVMWTDGLDHPMNTPRRKPLSTRRERREARAIGSVPIRSASFVSMLVDASAVREDGLPIAEYFLWNDDFEFSARVLRKRRGLFVPASVVIHKTKQRADTDTDPGERFYFEVRNKLWLFRSSSALAWYEIPLYVAAAARRWFRTWMSSSDRATIKRTFRAGVRDGFRKTPRTNDRYLSTLGIDDPSVAEFEA